jgi:hypothetical protein
MLTVKGTIVTLLTIGFNIASTLLFAHRLFLAFRMILRINNDYGLDQR